VLALAVPVRAQHPSAGKNTFVIRGKEQTIYFYRATGGSAQAYPPVVFAPGDFGMHGFAYKIAEVLASCGHDVYAVDTRRYLESFTGKNTLQVADVGRDFAAIARWVARGPNERVVLAGWSEGAGLCLLAAASNENKGIFSGLIVLGLSESNVLAWRWSDYLSYVTKKDPNEPSFRSADYLPRVAPLPFYMIQSTGDQYTSKEAARNLFSIAVEPKRFQSVEARDHRFEGNEDGLFGALREGLEWIRKTAP
jgi:pimeloyl-ACP methyl ester carboxylesterase